MLISDFISNLSGYIDYNKCEITKCYCGMNPCIKRSFDFNDEFKNESKFNKPQSFKFCAEIIPILVSNYNEMTVGSYIIEPHSPKFIYKEFIGRLILEIYKSRYNIRHKSTYSMELNLNKLINNTITIEVCDKPFVNIRVFIKEYLDACIATRTLCKNSYVIQSTIKNYISKIQSLKFKKYSGICNELKRITNKMSNIYDEDELLMCINDILIIVINLN